MNAQDRLIADLNRALDVIFSPVEDDEHFPADEIYDADRELFLFDRAEARAINSGAY